MTDEATRLKWTITESEARPEVLIGGYSISFPSEGVGVISIMRDGEGGWFSEIEFSEMIGQFVSERL